MTKRQQLTEYLRGLDLVELAAGTPRVDREHCVIHGVRICGLISDNGRKYPPQTLAKAARLYENAKVKISHRKRGEGERPITETFGWLAEVAPDPHGVLRGNLHYLKSHPLAEQICEAAERNPNLWGLSHDIEADTKTDPDGTVIITEIFEVRSVDLVDEPATGSGIFESKEKPIMANKVKLTLKTVLSEAKHTPKLSAENRKKLLEMGAACGETMGREYEADEPGVVSAAPDADKDWKQHLVDAIGKLCQKDDAEAHAVAMKIMGLLKPVEAETTEEEETPEPEPDAKGEDDTPEKKESRQLKSELKTLQETSAIRDQLDDAGLTFKDSAAKNRFIKLLLPLTADERKEEIQERKASAGPDRGVKRGGAYTPPPAPGKKPVQEGTNGQATPPSIKDTARALMS